SLHETRIRCNRGGGKRATNFRPALSSCRREQMSVLIKEKDLAVQLAVEQAVEAANTTELAEAASKLQRGLPALIDCDKDLAPLVFVNTRNRPRTANLRCLYLDGRPRQEDAQPATPVGLIGTMIAQLREAVRGAVERRVVVLPHLDLLTTS